LKVNLSMVANQSTIRDRYPYFNWTTAYDADNDSINYTLWIDENECPWETYGTEECLMNPISFSLNVTEYNLSDELGFDSYYNWTVRATDGENYSEWSDQFNFTVEGHLSLTLGCTGCNDVVEFGEVWLGQEYNTTDDDPSPIIMENDGNVFLDIKVNASSLWDSVNLDTEYFKFKAGNASESHAFNWSNSTVDWTNLAAEMRYVVEYLNYSNASDMAEIELMIKVPTDEVAGTKTTNLNIEARYYE
jgi:hypothetical protein